VLVAAGAALAVVADLAQVMPYLPQSGDWVPVVWFRFLPIGAQVMPYLPQSGDCWADAGAE
jgi:hypothetical protein